MKPMSSVQVLLSRLGKRGASHLVKQAHIEVVLDAKGNLKKGRIRKLDAAESETMIPATEDSASRSGAKSRPHPLCDEVSYCAPDSMPSAKNSPPTLIC